MYESYLKMEEKKRVCVVGAGAAGICAARHLLSMPESFTFDVYEQTEEIGGTWVYTDEVGIDSNGLPVHSSMYKNLRTNFLQEVMNFPDFPFPDAQETSYPRHDVVLQYLRDYVSHFDILKHIRFTTHVKMVAPEETGWLVTVYNNATKIEETKEYDSVLLCSGHNSTPDIPPIRGIEQFKGRVSHSHDYRVPEDYRSMRVLVLGASASGKDIALDLSPVAEKIYLAHSLPRLLSEFPENVVQCQSVAEALPEGFVLEDGMEVQADALVYCTGYKYSFPFLSPQCGVRVRGKRVTPLFKHMVNIELPTMGIIGIPFVVVPLPMFHFQVLFFLETLRNPSVLPSKEDMYAVEERDFQRRLELGFPPRHAHKMAQLQWEYNDELADVAGVGRLHRVFRHMCYVCSERMTHSYASYRHECLREDFQRNQLRDDWD